MISYAKKKWGQNFLVDKNLLKKIVTTFNPKKEDKVLEIGPGEGALTELILPLVHKMAAVEIDPLLVQRLQSLEHLKNCHFIHKDVLSLELNSLPLPPPLRIIGNIPYNITSQILFWLIKQRNSWGDAFLMVQKEVAARLTGKVCTKEYGRITVMISAFMDIETCFNISPDVFVPKPKVHSTIIRLIKKQKPLIRDNQFILLEKIVWAAFSQRRKMLRNTLKGFRFDQRVVKEINFERRPETLTIQEFVSLLK